MSDCCFSIFVSIYSRVVVRKISNSMAETVIQLDVLTRPVCSPAGLKMPFGAVYDGHGGNLCSAFVKKKLHVYIREAMDVDALEKAGSSL